MILMTQHVMNFTKSSSEPVTNFVLNLCGTEKKKGKYLLAFLLILTTLRDCSLPSAPVRFGHAQTDLFTYSVPVIHYTMFYFLYVV